MDDALDLYKDDLFRGDYPSDEEAMLRRFLLCLKCKSSFFTSDSRTKTSKKYLLNPLEETILIVTAKAFSKMLNNYLHGSISGEELLYGIYRSQNKRNKSLEPTQLELLAHLRDSMI